MKKVLLILILILTFSTQVKAEAATNITANLTQNSSDTAKIDQLYQYITNIKTKYELLNEVDAKTYVNDYLKTGDSKISVKKVANALITYMFRELGASMNILASIVLIAIICSLLTNLQRAFTNEGLSNIAYFACYSILIIILAKCFYIGVDAARSTISEMTNFMNALMPILIMLLASVGGIAQAATLDPIIIGTITLSANIFMNFIIPIICLAFVLQFVNNMSEEYKIDKLTSLLNQIVIWSQGLIMTLFIGIVTVRGITSTTIDQVTARTAKFAVDTFVPVVGKSLSDAVSTVAGYSLLLKNSISSLGLVIIVVIMLFPVIKLLIMALMFKLTAALIEPVSDSRLVNCISSAGGSMILITSCLICVSVMFFIIIAIIASAGKIALGG